MANKDILAGFQQPTSDMNIPAPSNGAVSDLGAQTAKPTGRIDYGQVADSLRQMPSAPQGAPASAPPSLPQSENSAPAPQQAPQQGATDVQPAPAQTPNPTPVAPPAPAPAPKTDLLSGFAPPTIQQQNQDALNSGANLQNPITPADEQAKKFVDQDHAQAMTLAQTRFTPDQIASFKNNPIGAGEAYTRFLNVNQTMVGGMVDQGYEALKNLSIEKKIAAGQPVTDAEKNQLYDMVDKQLEMKLRGFSFGGGVAYYGSQIPAFVSEFLLTGGVGKAAEEATVGAATKIGMNTLMAKASGLAVSSATRLPTFYVGNYGETRLNDFSALTDKGALIEKENQNSPASAALRAFGYTEAAAVGQELTPAIGALAEKAGMALKTPIAGALNQLAPEVRQGLYEAYKAIQPNAQISKAFSAMGWNGMISQLGALQVQQVLSDTANIAADKNYTWHDYVQNLVPSADQLKVAGGLIAIGGGISAATHITTNLLMEKGLAPAAAQDAATNMTALEKEHYIDKNLPTPSSEYPEQKTPEVNQPATMAQGMDDKIMQSQIKASAKVDPPPVDDKESSFNNLYRKAGAAWKEFYASAVNDTQAIEDLSPKAIKSGAEVPTGENTAQLVTAARSLGLADANIKFKRMYRDAETGALIESGKALKPIMDDFDNLFQKTEPDWQQRHDDFSTYQIARRQLYLGETREDYKITPEQIDKYHNDIGSLSEKYGKDFPFFETLFKENMDWRQGMLHDNAVKTGLMSQERFDAMIKNNDIYAPSYRILSEDEAQQFAPSSSQKLGKNPNIDNVGSVGNEATGSELDIKNVFQSDVKNAVMMTVRGENNRLKLAMAKKADFYPDDIKLVDEPSKTSVAYYDNGEKKYMEVSPQIQKAFQGFAQSQRDMIGNWIDKILTTQKNVLQIGATSTGGFFIGHFLRTVQLAFVNSLGKTTPMDFMRGLFHVVGNTDEYKDWQANTGFGTSPMKLDDPTLAKFQEQMVNGKTIMEMVNPKNIHDQIMKVIDHPARLATYEALKRNGTPQLEAAVQSLENTMNYGRKGSWVREYGRWSPFLNPPIQTIDRMATLFKDHPAAYTTAALLSQTLPQMMLTGYYLYGADDKTREEYLQIPSELRFAAANIKIGDHWVPIRRPFALGYIFGSMPEQMMIHNYSNGRPEANDFYSNMIGGLMKSAGFVTDPTEAIPPMFKSMLEGMTNHNLYFNSSLYPDYKKELPAYARTNNGDTDFAKWLGKELNMSPAVIDNTISEMSGNLGKWMVTKLDAAGIEIDTLEGKKVSEPPSGFENSTMSHGLIDKQPIGFNSQSVQQFYERFDKANEAHKQ